MTTAIILLYLATFITAVIIVVNTNSTSKALAYLLLIFLFPVVGLFVYFSIGRNYRVHKLYSKKLAVDRAAFPELESQFKAYSEAVVNSVKGAMGCFISLAQFNKPDTIITVNNKVDLLINGEIKFPDVIEAIRHATKFIHIEYYIFEDDTIGNSIGELLKQKTQEGVKVRFIYDDFGSKSIRKSFIDDLREHGVEAFPFYKIKLLFFANRMNHRNHRKIIIIDGIIGYVGGINVSDKYCNPNSDNLYWRDTHIKLTGSSVLSLQRVFLSDWNFCAKQNLQVTKELFPIEYTFDDSHKQVAQIISSGPDSDFPNIMYAMTQAILLSKSEVLITTPYFVPEASFLNAIKIARLSGVDIKLLVPGVSDSILVNATSSSYYQELLSLGVEIYTYQKGFVHAKTMVCDSFVSTVGTTNLDERSFNLNFEINAFVYDKTFANELRATFYRDIEDAVKLNLEDWNNRPYHIRFFERVMRLFSGLM